MVMSDLVVGIDASRNRSGGAKAHLIGILEEANPHKYGISEVHVWSYKKLLDILPKKPWLIKHNPKEIEKSLFSQVSWQRFKFSSEARKCGCSIMLNTDAGSVSSFQPSITMSRDMASYESGVIEKYGFSKARLRLILLRYIQNRSFRKSCGVIFLTQYAAKVIQQSCGKISHIAIIPHGVSDNFKNAQCRNTWPQKKERPIRCIYVSPVWEFKHQWVVARAVERLRKKGYNITLLLVGGGNTRSRCILDKQLTASDPEGEFVIQHDFVPQAQLPNYLADSDVFVFASSCENMPNTLLEAMAVGLPIACSNRGPMPEILKDGGVYFDPENADSIAVAIEKLIIDEGLRLRVSKRAKQLSEQYSWSRCSNETFAFIADTYRRINNA
jgi:glycosyltransferase involved in cell wall biosynthesis